MDLAMMIREIDAFLHLKGITVYKEISDPIIIRGMNGDTDLQIVFSIKKKSCKVKIKLYDQSLYLDVNEFAEKLHASIWIDDVKCNDYDLPYTIPDTTETVIQKASIKSEMDPNGIPSDERFLEIVAQIKNKMQAEIPIMAKEVIEQLGDDLTPDMLEKLKQAVYATATTTSMLTIRFLMETINDVIGDK